MFSMFSRTWFRDGATRRHVAQGWHVPCEVLEARSFPAATSAAAAVGFQFDARQATAISVDGVNLLHPIYLIGSRSGQYLAFGPYTTAISNGQHTATFRLQLDNVRADNRRILTIDVFDADIGRMVSSMNINRRDFRSASTYQDFNLNFTGAAGHRFEFRTFWHGHSYAKLDRVTVN